YVGGCCRTATLLAFCNTRCGMLDSTGATGPAPNRRVGRCGPGFEWQTGNQVGGGEEATMRILVVEDHPKLATTIATGLRPAGMAVDVVFDGHDALDHLAVTGYDVVVLDRDIPGVHGDEVCKRLRADRSPTRILMLTAAGTVADRVQGLGIGADDYLPKPCDFS